MLVKIDDEQVDRVVAETLFKDADALKQQERLTENDNALIEAMFLVRDYYIIQGD